VRWLGGELLAVQQGWVKWVHRDPVAKSERLTGEAGNVVAVVELDPWGGETERSENPRSQPYVYGGYERDDDGVDQALMRSYHGWWTRFNESDPWEGSYDLTDPQSFNRYAYVQNDPVNFTDPSGLFALNREYFEAMEALWELWLFGMQMNQRLLPSLVDGVPELPAVPSQTTASRQDLHRLVNDCRIRAMLDTIAYAEGTAGDPNNGYGTLVRGEVVRSPNNPALVGQRDVIINDFSQHPNALVRVGGSLYSTAAGRYQIRYQTWNELGLSDFSPENQDLGAVILMQRRGMIDPLLSGNFAQAIKRGNREWASLPGSPYGQGRRGMAQLQRVYKEALANCQRQQNR
jgi:RHS repeat-associated protein